MKGAYARYEGSLEAVLRDFVLYLKSTFGDILKYAGTTTDLTTPLRSAIRDLDVLVVLSELDEVHVSFVWRIINRLHAKYNIALDVRLHSLVTIKDIPRINKYLLKTFLLNQVGENPFLGFPETPQSLAQDCIRRIGEQENHIIGIMPRIAGDPQHLKSVAQAVYDAIRAYLLLQNHPIASKEQARTYFCEHYPRFAEADAIYEAYLDPQSVVDVTSFLFDSLALVKHLRHKCETQPPRNEVLLINTPSSAMPHPRNDYLSYDHNMPLGLLCLATYLRDNGVSVRVLDAYAENLGVLAAIDRLFAPGPVSRVVGLNVSSPNIHIAHKIAAYVKRVDDRVVVVCGGPHASLAAKHTLSTGDVDFAVVGEGEKPLLALVNELFARGTVVPGTIPGVFSTASGEVVGSRNKIPLDLARMPPPDFSFLPMDRYFAVRRRLYVHTSRGCSFNCIYCSVPRSWGRRVREVPADRLFGYLEELVRRYSPCEFQIVDDNFSHKRGHLIRQLCELVRSGGLGFRWKCQARADQLDRDLIAAMAECGCFEVDLGIESGNRQIQKYVRKNLDLEQTVETVASICEHRMKCKAFFMLGFPEETYDQVADTINYAIRLKDHGLEDVAFFPVMPFPGTEISTLTGRVVFQGAIIDEVDRHEHSFSAQRLRKFSAKPEISLNAQFTVDELRFLVKLAYTRFELGLEVRDLKAELASYIQSEEGVMYAI